MVERLRAGDEAAFTELVERLHPSLVRLASVFAGGAAEEVAQETWVAVITGLDRFEGRSSLTTWIGRILVNRARTRGVREGRSVPMSSLDGSPDDHVDRSRFGRLGFWSAPPEPWETPEAERRLLDAEARGLLEVELAKLPSAQRAVVELRDVDGWSADEVCNVLEITETNQRVLLHRGRTRLRGALERYVRGG